MADIDGLSYWRPAQIIEPILPVDTDTETVPMRITLTPQIEGLPGRSWVEASEVDPPQTLILTPCDLFVVDGTLDVPDDLHLLAQSNALTLHGRNLWYQVEPHETVIGDRAYRLPAFTIAAPVISAEDYDPDNIVELDLTAAPRVNPSTSEIIIDGGIL